MPNDKEEGKSLEASKQPAYLTAEEQRAASAWKEKRFRQETLLKMREYKTNDSSPGNIAAGLIEGIGGSEEEKIDLFGAALAQATGASDPILAQRLLGQCLHASCTSSSPDMTEVNAVVKAVHALQPQDETEGMLITRLVALHNQNMHFMAKVLYKNQTSEAVDLNINRSTKLTRLYNETLEALMRYRRKGEQKVVVQHVNVSNGGQAVVTGSIQKGEG